MEEKKPIKVSLGGVVSIFIIIILMLIIVMGAFMYMQKTESDRQIAELKNNASELEETINNLQEDSELKEMVLGEYEYDVPQEVKEEMGHYYDGICIELLENEKFKYYYGEGYTLEGIFQIENNNIICNAKTIEGERLDKQEINVKYTFKYSNNTLEIINKEGKVEFETTDYGISSNHAKIKEIEEVYEEIGSKYVKNIENHNDTTNKLNEEEALEILNEKFKIAENLWLNPLKYFKKSSNKTSVNNGKYCEIIDFEKTIKKYGTDRFVQEFNSNMPDLFFKENNKVYTFEGTGGERKYAGLDTFENIEITSSSITATLKTKQSTYKGKEWVPTSGKSSEFKLIKEGNEWLIDKFNSSDLD